ncbi:MAG: GIY-YIG nuclease family protein [Patescibacteria group bacterium]
MFFVYILYSKAFDRYYVGSTSCLETRVVGHNAGKTRSTKPFGPWEMVYHEGFQTRTEARKRENKIKRFKGGNAFKALIQRPL